MTLRTLNYGNYGIFLIMGNAGFLSINRSRFICECKGSKLANDSDSYIRSFKYPPPFPSTGIIIWEFSKIGFPNISLNSKDSFL